MAETLPLLLPRSAISQTDQRQWRRLCGARTAGLLGALVLASSGLAVSLSHQLTKPSPQPASSSSVGIPTSLQRAIAGAFGLSLKPSLRATPGGATLSTPTMGAKVGPSGALVAQGSGAALTLQPLRLDQTALSRAGRVAVAGGVARQQLGPVTVSYRTTSSGVEQSFTVVARPTEDHGTTTISLGLSGGFHVASTSSTGLVIKNATGSSSYRYSGLAVADALGDRVPARLVGSGQSVRIVMDTKGASFPLHVDPTLTSSAAGQIADPNDASGAVGDFFGKSVSVDGDGKIAVVGAEGSPGCVVPAGDTFDGGDPPGYQSGSTCNADADAGAAYVFLRSGSAPDYTWTEASVGDLGALVSPALQGGALFGHSVSISDDGTVIAVGAMHAGGGYALTSSGYTGGTFTLDWDGTDASFAYDATAAQIQSALGTGAVVTGAQLNSDGTTPTTVVITVPSGTLTLDASAATGPGTAAITKSAAAADPTDPGAAYVFTSSDSWSSATVQALAPTTTVAGALFGTWVSVAGDSTSGSSSTIAVGAPGPESNCDLDSSNGAAYLFTGSGSSWSEQAEVTETAAYPDTCDAFGQAVGLSASGAVLAVGSPGTSTDLNVSNDSGAVYVYDEPQGGWASTSTPAGSLYADPSGTSCAPTTPESTTPCVNLNLGYSVAISGDGSTVLAGAPDTDGTPNVPGDNPTDGEAYVFTETNGSWNPGVELLPNDGAPGDDFGFAVALSSDGNVALVGADAHEVGNEDGQGAAYLFASINNSWTAEAPEASPVVEEESPDTQQAGSSFGFSLALNSDGSTALIDAPADASINAYGGTTFGFAPPPVISSVSSSSGVANSTLTIDGLGFTSGGGSPTVSFGGTPAAVSASSATTITVSVPQGSGTVPITVTSGSQTTSEDVEFTYTGSTSTGNGGNGGQSTNPTGNGGNGGQGTTPTGSTSGQAGGNPASTNNSTSATTTSPTVSSPPAIAPVSTPQVVLPKLHLTVRLSTRSLRIVRGTVYHLRVSLKGAVGAPRGRVLVKNGKSTLCSVVLKGGSAICTISTKKIAIGHHRFTVSFAGTATYAGVSESIPAVVLR